MQVSDESMTQSQYALLDRVANAIKARRQEEILRLYGEESGLKVPDEMMVAGIAGI
jgi:hypothetical protein